MLCKLLGHKFGPWHREGGHTLTGTFEYDFRRCTRCHGSEAANHVDTPYFHTEHIDIPWEMVPDYSDK